MTYYWNDPLQYDKETEINSAEQFADILRLEEFDKPAGWSEEAWQLALLEAVPVSDKELGENSLIYFIRHYLEAHLSNKFAPAHYQLCQELQTSKTRKRILWLFPREHAKTTIITFAHTLWCICYNKKSNIVICSDTQKQAKEFLRNIKTELSSNSRIIKDFGELQGKPKKFTAGGEVGGKWDEEHVVTANGVQIKVFSPGSQIRGLNFNRPEKVETEEGEITILNRLQRPDLVVLDDIINDKNVKNKDLRDEMEEWLFSTVFNAMDSEKGDLIVVGTVLHFDDLLERTWKNKDKTDGWVKRKTPACILNEKGYPTEVLWPDRWPAEKLLQRRNNIGSLAFAREFLLNPRDDDASYFRHDWFKLYIDHTATQTHATQMFHQGLRPPPKDLLLVTSIDPNTREKDSADYTVVLTMGFSPTTRCYYVLDAERDRPSPERQVMMMINQALKWGQQFRDGDGGWLHLGFVIETVAYQHTIQYWLKKFANQFGITDLRYYPREETSVDKQQRLASVSPMVEQRRLFFPAGSRINKIDQSIAQDNRLQWLMDELNDFPKGSYDDGCDALQRAYSVLIREERRYTYQGHYGPAVQEAHEQYLKSFPAVENYLKSRKQVVYES